MRFVVMLACSAMSTLLVAGDRFYTTVDAQGRVQVVKGEEPDKAKVKSLMPKEEVPSRQDIQKLSTEVEQGTRQLGADTYIDTELLEKKNFNLQDKKRFYYLPDGSLGTQVIESKDGVVSNPPPIKEVVKPVAYVSNNYMLLSKENVVALYPQQNTCVTSSSIKKKSKPFKDINNIWVQPPFIPNTLEMDAFLSFSTQVASLKQLRIVSFARTHKNASFYLPMVVFLDNKGCTLSGAWQYWSRAHAATETQYASVDGLVSVPDQSAYVVFYRPNNTLKADIPLSSESGSFVVEAY